MEEDTKKTCETCLWWQAEGGGPVRRCEKESLAYDLELAVDVDEDKPFSEMNYLEGLGLYLHREIASTLQDGEVAVWPLTHKDFFCAHYAPNGPDQEEQ